jgi:hypothetical protein
MFDKLRSSHDDGLRPTRADLFRLLTNAPGSARNNPRRRRETPLEEPHRPQRRRRNCRCGQCERCLEDARWEKIFNEKFADPYYYAPLQLHQRSTLAEVF